MIMGNRFRSCSTLQRMASTSMNRKSVVFRLSSIPCLRRDVGPRPFAFLPKGTFVTKLLALIIPRRV